MTMHSFVLACLLLLAPLPVWAWDFYTWTDDKGVRHLSSTPPPEGTATDNLSPGQDYRMRPGGEVSASRPGRETSTPVTVSGNQVLVPVQVKAGRRAETLMLLLDTGASRTVLYRDVTARLPLRDKQETRFQVADGRVSTGALAVLDSLELGPHRLEKVAVGILERRGMPLSFAGLLGMDVLKDLAYRIDAANSVIVWKE